MKKNEQEAAQTKVGVGAVVFRDDEVLLIKRGKEPFLGRWSIPGGKLEFGEILVDAVRREVREETAVEIDVLGLIDVFEITPRTPQEGAHPGHMVLVDYVADWRSGEPVAGDDALEAKFFPLNEALERLSWDETRRAVSKAVELRSQIRKNAANPL